MKTRNKPKIITIADLWQQMTSNNARRKRVTKSALLDAEHLDALGVPFTILMDRQLGTFQILRA